MESSDSRPVLLRESSDSDGTGILSSQNGSKSLFNDDMTITDQMTESVGFTQFSSAGGDRRRTGLLYLDENASSASS